MTIHHMPDNCVLGHVDLAQGGAKLLRGLPVFR
jgi:hypothetical protein